MADDLISRNDLLELVCKRQEKLMNDGAEDLAIAIERNAIAYIKRLPSIHSIESGTWIQRYDEFFEDYDYGCPFCNRWFWMKGDFCPCCGAKLKEE